MFRQYGSQLNWRAVLKHSKASAEYSVLLAQGTSNADYFMSMDCIKVLFIYLNSKRQDINLKAAAEDLKHLKGKKSVSAKKKLSASKKG
ncbi:MAG: hypothetical protein LBK52_04510 [Deltaproteobacteria bacterium]|nr:hypothetical protein [Deltaproteobacteria bacterium]